MFGRQRHWWFCAGATFTPDPDWYWNFRHRVEGWLASPVAFADLRREIERHAATLLQPHQHD